MTSEYFQVMTRECGLSYEELSRINIGDALDVVYTYIELHDPDREVSRKATQKDIDGLFHG